MKGVAFALMVLESGKPLRGMVLERGRFALYGLEKGVSSVVDILDGWVYFYIETGHVKYCMH